MGELLNKNKNIPLAKFLNLKGPLEVNKNSMQLVMNMLSNKKESRPVGNLKVTNTP